VLLLARVAPSAVKGQAEGTLPGQSQAQAPTQGDADLAEAGRQHALAVSLFNEKKYDEALVAAKRAAELREKSLGAEHFLTRASLNNLAQVYIARRDYGEALKILQRLLPIYEKVLKPGSEEMFKTLELFAALAGRERKPGDAERAYKRNLELREAASGDSPQTARALYLLASLLPLQQQARSSQAALPARRFDLGEERGGILAGVPDGGRTLFVPAA
jgi:tetratricopeptide (TPR) repeat protein